MDNKKRRMRHLSYMLAVSLIVTMIPFAAFADDNAEGQDSYREDETFELSDIDPADSDDLLEKYLYQEATIGQTLSAQSDKGYYLSGNNSVYYKYIKKLFTKVAAGSQSETYIEIPLSKFLGNGKITASQLGVSKIGYISGGKWYMTSAAKKKFYKLVEPESWNAVYLAAYFDFPYDSYWVDWTSDSFKYEWNVPFTYNKTTLKCDLSSSNAYLRIYVPVTTEYSLSTGNGNRYLYYADTSKTKSVQDAIANATYCVSYVEKAFKEEYPDQVGTAYEDYFKLYNYMYYITSMTDYDYDAAATITSGSSSMDYGGPWAIVNVFDDDSSTLAVCEGYSKAFKYLCDISTFNSKWIECQTVTGDVYQSNGASEGHMWNVVRMNDGQNYLVDVTWSDPQDDDAEPDDTWFLRGAPDGNAKEYTIDGYRRVYDSMTLSALKTSDRVLSTNDSYTVADDVALTVKGTSIKSLKKAKKAFTVKWEKQTTGASNIYIEGYQIQYATKKSFKDAKTVTVKGYSTTSKKIKSLKSKKKYYVRIRTYIRVNNEAYYSSWSSAKTVKTK